MEEIYISLALPGRRCAMVDDKYSEPGAKMIISMYRKPAITNQICVSDIAPCNCLCGGRKGNCAI